MSKLLEQFKSEEELLKLTPTQLLEEHEKWQSLMAKHRRRFDKEEDDERAMLICDEVDRIADYLDDIEKRAQTNASYYEEERAKVEETCVNELHLNDESSTDATPVAITPDLPPDVAIDVAGDDNTFDEIDEFNIEIEDFTKAEIKETKVKRKKQTKDEKEAKKNKESAIFVKDKLDKLNAKAKKRRNPGKLAQNPKDRSSDFNEPAMTRMAAERDPGEKKGDWYQVSFRTPKTNKPQIQEYAHGAVAWLKGIMKPIGIYISYCAECIFLADYENRMYWSTDRRRQLAERFVKFGEWYMEGGVGMPQFEIDNIERCFHYFRCDTDFKKKDQIEKFKKELAFHAETDFYEYVREYNEAQHDKSMKTAQEMMDSIDDTMEPVDEKNDLAS